MPSEVSVSEGDGTAEVCATLSSVSGSDLPISIILATTTGIVSYAYICFYQVYDRFSSC